MSSIPVRRATRLARPVKDNENANARPSRLTTRSKTVGVPAAGTSVTTRATASTAASKAKSVVPAPEKETGVKRKREALVEVTANNKDIENAKGKDGKEGKDGATKETIVKPVAKPVIKPPSRRIAATAGKRLVARAVSVSKETTTTIEEKVAVEAKPVVLEPIIEAKPVQKPVVETMEIDETRQSKRRHTDTKPLQDDSQLEADKVAAELEAAEPSVQHWDDLDADDWDDPIMVSEYVSEVCVYLKQIELETMPNPDYMKDQTEITWEHRGVLVDWLLQVHSRFNLLAESLFLTINVIDRFLSRRPISLAKVQLVGIAAFLIATKFEETYAPSVKEIAFLADNQYEVEEILKAERFILKTLDYDLRSPGPMNWLRRGSKADDCETHARTIGKYLLEIALVERRLIGYVPSHLAAAALWLARLCLGREEWTSNLEHYTTYSEKEILPVAKIMLEYIITDPIQHESLFKKYASKRYFRCSKYIQGWACERWTLNSDIRLERDLPVLKEEIREARLQEAAEEGGHGENEGGDL
ncbi:hypothetical protein D9619_010678 [Psilocybe cf. subviscida]|uniref:Cyclin N-terminal domain-containing protein n=1 Tax=Psilocybe cf. subviscida TaxID=2480587 RepID=A0A8H5BA63_9AGAR|nr:hypothetical protein D9619_010678 [Psilocybe cf. subviscida]